MNLLADIFRWNFRRFSRSEVPTNLIVEKTDGKQGSLSFCSNAIAVSVRTHGKKIILPVNLVLFFLGVILMVADDYIALHTVSYAVHLLTLCLPVLFLVFKFDAWKIRDAKNILKFGYIFFSAFISGFFSITYFFLILFENIIAFHLMEGV